MTPQEGDRVRWQRRCDAISGTMLSALDDGHDVAELVVCAAGDAERRAARSGRSILDNRSGSWEASLLGDMLQSGGAHIDDQEVPHA